MSDAPRATRAGGSWLRPWARFVPTKDAGMSDDEARLAGILPPAGHVPRGASASETLRALGAYTRAMACVARHLARDRNRYDSVPQFQTLCRDTLAALGIELDVVGRERVPERGVLFMWNQTSHLDHLILPCAIDRPTKVLYNLEVSRVPLYGEWLRRNGHYLVDRYDERQWREAIERAAGDVRERGVSMILSPEGTRSWDGTLLPMKRGAFILAVASGAPIVPVVIEGAHAALPRGGAVVRPTRIEVELGEPIDTRPYDESTRPALMARTAEALARRTR